MQGHKLIEDCKKKLRISEYEVFLLAFQANIKYQGEDVREDAVKFYQMWISDHVVPTVVWDFCVNILSGRITLIEKKAG